MKDFTRPRGRLRSLPVAARAVYSVFLVFTLAALGITTWLGQQMVGANLGRLDAYYAGAPEPGAADAHAAAPAATPETGGPTLELPPEAELAPAAEPMPLRKLLEVTHFHLFSIPVYLLILSHLFMLSRASEPAKLGWIAAGTLSVALHIAAPWIARSGALPARALYGGSGGLMALSFLVMAIGPLWEMWSTPDRDRPEA